MANKRAGITHARETKKIDRRSHKPRFLFLSGSHLLFFTCTLITTLKKGNGGPSSFSRPMLRSAPINKKCVRLKPSGGKPSGARSKDDTRRFRVLLLSLGLWFRIKFNQVVNSQNRNRRLCRKF